MDWTEIVFGKSIEYWAVILGMVLYVAFRDGEAEPVSVRIVKTVSSGLLAFGTANSLADYLGISETLCVVLIMAFGLILLDVMTGFAKDRDFIKELIKRKIGGGK